MRRSIKNIMASLLLIFMILPACSGGCDLDVEVDNDSDISDAFEDFGEDIEDAF